jgi:LmbE family N-acetylglucosaminyl deacetylase
MPQDRRCSRFTVSQFSSAKLSGTCSCDRFEFPLKNVLAVFAHPDDAELTCFGTLGILKSHGYRVLVGIVTDGVAGSPVNSARVRFEEAKKASAIMGFDLLRGALPDGDLQYSSRLIMQVEQWVSEYKPAIVVTHDYHLAAIDHQDHIAVARAMLNVAQRKPDIELLLQVEPSRGSRSFEPNAFVDVTPFATKKLAAIACHKTQSHKDYLQPAYIKLRSNWWAAVSGMWDASGTGSEAHVEAFRIAKSSIFASSALAFTSPFNGASHADEPDRTKPKYPRLRRVV